MDSWDDDDTFTVWPIIVGSIFGFIFIVMMILICLRIQARRDAARMQLQMNYHAQQPVVNTAPYFVSQSPQPLPTTTPIAGPPVAQAQAVTIPEAIQIDEPDQSKAVTML